jgi:hypothetical protein
MGKHRNPHYYRDYFRKQGEVRRAYLRERYAANPSKQALASRKYRESAKGQATRKAYYARPEVRARQTALCRRYRAAKPELYRRQALHRRLRALGVDPNWYENQLAIQGGGCAICQSPKPGGRAKYFFHVDHDHTTQAIRGLLCLRCNVGIGLFQDDEAVLARAAQYLKEYR